MHRDQESYTQDHESYTQDQESYTQDQESYTQDQESYNTGIMLDTGIMNGMHPKIKVMIVAH